MKLESLEMQSIIEVEDDIAEIKSIFLDEPNH